MLGTCAGAIVLAREVSNPPQPGLGLIDVAIARNAYGRQVDSFIAEIAAPALGAPMPAVFSARRGSSRPDPASRSSARTGESRSSCARATSWRPRFTRN